MNSFLIALLCALVATISCYSQAKCKSSELCLGASDSKCGKRFDRLELTVQIESGTDKINFPFCVDIDKFSRVNLEGSYQWMTTGGRSVSNARLRILASKVVTKEAKVYATSSDYATALTAILHFGAYGGDSGVIKSITWDDTCSNNRCIFNNGKNCINGKDCSQPLNDATDRQRDVSIFLGFRGSDKFGNIFTSANEVPKSYRAFSFSLGAAQIYDKVWEKFS